MCLAEVRLGLDSPSDWRAYARQMNVTPALACNVSAMSSEQRSRHTQLVQHLQTATVEQLPDGLSLAFPPTPEHALILAEFMTLERRCCPFLTLQLEFAPENGPLTLRLTGPAGVQTSLRHELHLE